MLSATSTLNINCVFVVSSSPQTTLIFLQKLIKKCLERFQVQISLACNCVDSVQLRHCTLSNAFVVPRSLSTTLTIHKKFRVFSGSKPMLTKCHILGRINRFQETSRSPTPALFDLL